MTPEPPEAPEDENDPLIVRIFCFIFSYTVSIGIGAGVFAAVMFMLQTGLIFRSVARYNLQNIPESNQRILVWTKLAGAAGAVAGAWWLFNYSKDEDGPGASRH